MNLIKTATNAITKNSPLILTSLATAGVIGTVIFAVKATPNAVRILEENRKLAEEHGVEVTKRDCIRACWKLYLPAALIGASTIACIIASHSISMRRHAAIATLYSIAETGAKEYQDKVIEHMGESKEQKVRDDLAKDRINSASQSNVIFAGGDQLCFDSFSGRVFKSDAEKIRQAVNSLNHRLLTGQDSTLSLNDFYMEIGLPDIPLGNDIGWCCDDELIEVDFNAQLNKDNEPCLAIDFGYNPQLLY